MSEAGVDLQLQVKEAETIERLRTDLNHCFRELSLLREELRANTNSRRGIEGARGPIGPAGNPGRDAQIRIVQENGAIRVIDGEVVKAEIVAVAGPRGRDGVDGKSITGAKGDAGISPSIDAIVAEVVRVLEARLLRK